MNASKLGKLLGKIVLWIVGITVLVTILALLAGVFTEKIPPGEAQVPPPAAPDFTSIQPAEQLTEIHIESLPGTLSSRRETMISPRITATIGDILVNAGEQVQAGQLLVELDSRELEARRRQARETVQAARARLEEARKHYQRMQELIDEGTISESQFDQAEADFQTAQAELQRTEGALREAETALSYSELTAPFSGRVVDRYADPGDTTMPGQPIVKIYDPNQLRIEAYVRESLAAGLKPGQPLDVHIDAVGATVQGIVEEVVPQAEPGARAMLVKVSLSSREDLYPGMFARLLIPIGPVERLYVPADAVQRVGQLTYVWVIGENETPSRRYVKLGDNRTTGAIEVLSGLESGDRVGLPAH